MNNQENDQQHLHQEDGQEEAEEEQEEKEAKKEQENPEAAEDQEKLEAAEDQEKLEESEEEEKLEEAENHIMQSSSSTNSQSPPFGSPQLSTIASNHQAYSLHHPQAFKPPKPSSPPPSGAAVEGNTNIGISKTQDEEVADGKNDQESGGGGGGERRLRTNLSILRRVRRENMKRRALLGFRISGFLFSLVSFSIMAADKNQGWALDSFNNYKEFRYCMAVNVLGFVYSSLQGYDVAYSLAIGKHAVKTQLRCFLDFSIDQILTYLLLSASSSAAFRVEDWESNWGTDEFPTMAKASVALSFLAFVAFAFCSLVSGYTLFTPNST